MIKKEIIKHFTDDTEAQLLSGGQGESYKIGNIVIKPVHEEEKYIWLANALEKINFENLQYSGPIKSKNGNYVEDSYCATTFIPGSFHEGRIEEKIKAAISFNSSIKNISKPIFFDEWKSPWTKAQDVAWSKQSIPSNLPARFKGYINELENIKAEINLQSQLVHCDFAGNILFNENEPIIIDFSPGFFPAEYSIICLVVDSIAWHNAKIDELKHIDLDEFTKLQLILRAVIFRLLVPYFFDSDNTDALYEEYNEFLPIIKYLNHRLPPHGHVKSHN
ncbi:hypothetical protein GF340_05925 [Candidatus Peregrinibacteria bacterium]|nr:hypothetical protein [Candidatus Peregrinibacteria bacterium]